MKKEVWVTALGVAVFPPLWAVLAPYINITTGPVALIAAGLFAASGNQNKDALKVSLGLLCGDVWAWLVITLSGIIPGNPDLVLYCLLFVFGGAAVLIASLLEKWIDLPGWLGGWAIGLLSMTLSGASPASMFVQVGVSMLVGVWYVGVFVNAVQGLILKKQ